MLIKIDEFEQAVKGLNVQRKIKLIQNHHTYKPGYHDFTGSNHADLIAVMRYYHVTINKWNDIAQHITTFPDGKIAIGNPDGRSFDTDPAGIRGANGGAICIEHVGNFDDGNDEMNDDHKITILKMNKILSDIFKLPLDTNHFVYHHWYDMDSGVRTGGTGNTKSCPGTNWFSGNSEDDAKVFLQLIGAKFDA